MREVSAMLDDGQLVYVISSRQFILFEVAHQIVSRTVCRR